MNYMHGLLSFVVVFLLSVFSIPADDSIIAEFAEGNTVWQLQSSLGQQDGAIFVLKKVGNQVTVIGGDSSPFPLSRYGVPPTVANELADRYVRFRANNTPGGWEALRLQMEGQEEIADDLHNAYSRRFVLTSEPFYATADQEVSDMVRVLREIQAVSKSDIKDYIRRHLRPLLPELVITVGDKPTKDLGTALIEAVKSHPEEEALQQAVAVYAGRQETHFRGLLSTMNDADLRAIREAILNAGAAGVIGGKIKVAAIGVAESLVVSR